MTSSESQPAARQALHALIVEDSPADAELMASELRHSGFDLTWQRVDTEADYLACLQKHRRSSWQTTHCLNSADRAPWNCSSNWD